MSYAGTDTESYTTTDVEIVVRRLAADLVMIGDSTGCWTGAEARDYAHDIEILAKRGFLDWVDVTLLSAAVERKAVRFEVDAASSNLVMQRPGGVLWPRLAGASLRIVINHTAAYTADERQRLAGRLRIGWVATYDDTTHGGLTTVSGRDYASNGYGIRRKDFGA
jgi:hypothetical protein